jgi:hypothetical protein
MTTCDRFVTNTWAIPSKCAGLSRVWLIRAKPLKPESLRATGVQPLEGE